MASWYGALLVLCLIAVVIALIPRRRASQEATPDDEPNRVSERIDHIPDHYWDAVGHNEGRKNRALHVGQVWTPATNQRGRSPARHEPVASAWPPAPRYGRWVIDYRKLTDEGHFLTERRTVRVLEVHPRLGHFRCWCELRNAERTFAIGGIKLAADAETGELIDLHKWMAAYTQSRRGITKRESKQ